MSSGQHDIAFDEWEDDIVATLGLQVQMAASKSGFPAAFRDQFARKYSDPTSRDHHRNRVEAALRWMEKNLDEIEATWPGETVSGGTEALVSSRLILALYGVYSRCPDDRLHDDFPVSILHRFLETK